MSNRESGWYRVSVDWCDNSVLMEWDSHTQKWYSSGYYEGDYFEEGDVQCHDPKMVMTVSGEIVYHQRDHNE